MTPVPRRALIVSADIGQGHNGRGMLPCTYSRSASSMLFSADGRTLRAGPGRGPAPRPRGDCARRAFGTGGADAS